MSFDMNNNYASAGPGAKRRVERLALDKNPKKIARKRKYQSQTPTNKKAAKERDRTINVTPRGLKHRIRLLTCRTDTFDELYRELQKASYPGSAVLVSGVRTEMLDCIRVLVEEGLLDSDQLAQHRRRYTKKQARV